MDVFDLRYMKRIRLLLRAVGAWPNHVFGDNGAAALSKYGHTGFLFTLCCVAFCGQACYLAKNMGVVEFIDLGQTCLTLLMSIVYMQRTLLPIQSGYQEVIKEFATKFNLIHHKHTTENSEKICNKVNRICEIATVVQIIQFIVSSFMFNAAPLFRNYRAGMFSLSKPVNTTFKYSVMYYLPWDDSNTIGYAIITVFNYFVSLSLGVLFCIHDLLICVIVFHIWGHLSILKHNLTHFMRPKNVKGRESSRYSHEENKQVTDNLKGIIIQHLKIKQFLAKASAAYSVTLCVYFGFHLVTDCVMLLECSTMEPDAIATYGLLTLVVYQQLIQLSVVFELVSSKGDTLADAVYGLPWECMDTSNRETVLILLQAAQQPLALKACNMVPVGVQTMQAIIKASLSYFMMLRAFAK